MTAKKNLKRRQAAVNAICAAIILVTGANMVTDGMGTWFGMPQYQTVANLAGFALWLVAIGFSDIRERCRPDLFTDEELKRKGL